MTDTQRLAIRQVATSNVPYNSSRTLKSPSFATVWLIALLGGLHGAVSEFQGLPGSWNEAKDFRIAQNTSPSNSMVTFAFWISKRSSATKIRILG